MTDSTIENASHASISKPVVDEVTNTDKFYYICEDTDKFRGTTYITVHEAVSMIEACLNDIETDFGKFDKNSDTYNILYLKSHFNGILLPCDSIYWSFADTKLKKDDMAVLLSRLLNKRNRLPTRTQYCLK